jgi:hypothetical protein
MTEQEALNTLVSAVRLANKRGAFELEESTMIMEAIKVFTKPEETTPNNDGDNGTDGE